MPSLFPHSRGLYAVLAILFMLAGGLAGSPAAAQGDAAPVTSYELPAGELAASLKELARETGLTLSVDPELVTGKRAPAVAGAPSAEAALDQLLEGSGLEGGIKDSAIVIRPVAAGTPEAAAPSHELRQINVTSASASGEAKDAASAPASVSVVTAEDLEGKAYRDITDALQAVPGVYVDEGAGSRGGSQEISIRGWDPKYTKILVDGRPQASRQAYYNGYGSGTEFGWLPPASAIERIEIIRGPMSSLYGSDAMGGVINVVTKSVPDEWGGSVSLDQVLQQDTDAGDNRSAQYYLSGPLSGRWALTLFGGTYDREEDDIANGFQDYSRDNNAAKLTWTPNEANELEFEVGYSTQESAGSEDASGDDVELDRIRRHQAISHDIDWDSGLRTRSYVQHALMDNLTQSASYERTSGETSTVIPFEKHVLTVGAHYRLQETRNPERALNKATLDRWDMALFAEDEWWITDPFALTTGLRWVDDENYGSQLVPRAYGVYTLSPQLTVKGGISAGYRTPDLKEGDSEWIEGGGGPSLPGGRDVGNSDLKPEESLTYELSTHWTGFSGLNASLTLYHTDYDNKIEKPVICARTPDGEGGFLYNCEYRGEFYQAVYQYQNVEKAELQGVEATFDFPLGARVRINSSYTYTRSEQLSGENRGDPLNDQPEHRANMGLDWRPTANTRVWSQARFRGRTEFSGRGGPDDGESPSYTIVDVGLKYSVNDRITLYGGVYNLLDKTLTNAEFGRLIDGRRLNLGTSITF